MINDSLKKKIDKHEVVSFDLYDTLVLRNVENPSDVFSLIEMQFNENYGEKNISNFKGKRIEAYKNAYECYGSNCTIDKIYEKIFGISEVDKSRLKTIEIELESSICCVNKNIVEAYNYAIKQRKRVFIISDMYLSMDIISSVLNRCGIMGYEKLYVSCEYGASKIRGDLFDLLCCENDISPKEVLHVGDGIKNDVIRGRLRGLDTFWVRKKRHLSYYDNSGLSDEERFQYSIQQAFINNHITDGMNEIEKIGIEVFGPLLKGFCCWLHERFEKENIEKVFFLAREGALFKDVYESIYPNEKRVIKYLYVSRKSLVSPTYWIMPNYKDVINSIAKSKSVSVENMIKRWGLDAESCVDEINAAGLSIDEIVDGRVLENNQKIETLYELLLERIIDESKKQYKNLCGYLKQEEFGGKCAIVDIGWNGGMQNAFEKIASVWEVPTEVHGYYIGINTSNLGVDLKNVNGYVYEQTTHEENRYAIYSFAGSFELSLTALHNTTVAYESKEDKYVPVFGKGEYINDDGSFTKELRYTEAVQKGIREYIKWSNEENLNSILGFDSEPAFRNCKLFGLMPLLRHIKLFDGFGANDLGEEQHFVSTKYRHLFGKYNVKSGFWNSTWKSGYLKMLFRLPLPYYKLYIKMRKKVN